MKLWHSAVVMLIVGYILGYYFRGLGNMTIGKLYASQ